MTLDSKITLSESLFLQVIDGETIILDTNTQEYFTLNGIGEFIYSLLEEGKNLREVNQELASIYDIDENHLDNDLLTFVQQLLEKKLIKESY